MRPKDSLRPVLLTNNFNTVLIKFKMCYKYRHMFPNVMNLFKSVINGVFRQKRVENARKPSSRSRVFDVFLVVIGVREPFQKLYPLNETMLHKLNCLIRPYRIYTVCIFTSLCVLPVRYFFHIIHNYNDEFLIHFAAETLLPLQYLLAVWYFGSNHIELFFDGLPRVSEQKTATKYINSSSLTNIREILFDIVNTESANDNTQNIGMDFASLIKQPCKLTINVVTVLIVIILVPSFTGSILTSHLDETDSLFPFYIISRSYGRGTCLLNTCLFAFAFYKHIKVLRLYGKILRKKNWSTQNYDNVSVMLINFTRMRESLKITTDATKSMYSSSTITGITIVGALIHSTTISASFRWRYDTFLMLGSFFVLQSIVFFVIAVLSLAKQQIEDVTKGSDFAMKFLARKKHVNEHEVMFENATTLDYWLIIDILSEKWLDFSIMGLPIHSLSFLKQCVSVVSLFIILVNTGTLEISEIVN